MNTTVISRISTYNFGNLAEYVISAEIGSREFLLKVQEDREYRLYLGHPSNGPLDERCANDIKASLEVDGIIAEVDKDMYGNYFVRTPMSGSIYAGIPGYGLVKDVTDWTAVEHGEQDTLFVVRRDCGKDYLGGLVEVCLNTRENYEDIRKRYPYNSEDYILWWGTVYHSPSGKDAIIFHWS